jgi:hypothetical protein
MSVWKRGSFSNALVKRSVIASRLCQAVVKALYVPSVQQQAWAAWGMMCEADCRGLVEQALPRSDHQGQLQKVKHR